MVITRTGCSLFGSSSMTRCCVLIFITSQQHCGWKCLMKLSQMHRLYDTNLPFRIMLRSFIIVERQNIWKFMSGQKSYQMGNMMPLLISVKECTMRWERHTCLVCGNQVVVTSVKYEMLCECKGDEVNIYFVLSPRNGDGKNSGARSVFFFFASRCTVMLTMIYINFYVTTSTRSRGPIDGPTGERYFHGVGILAGSRGPVFSYSTYSRALDVPPWRHFSTTHCDLFPNSSHITACKQDRQSTVNDGLLLRNRWHGLVWMEGTTITTTP